MARNKQPIIGTLERTICPNSTLEEVDEGESPVLLNECCLLQYTALQYSITVWASWGRPRAQGERGYMTLTPEKVSRFTVEPTWMLGITGELVSQYH